MNRFIITKYVFESNIFSQELTTWSLKDKITLDKRLIYNFRGTHMNTLMDNSTLLYVGCGILFISITSFFVFIAADHMIVAMKMRKKERGKEIQKRWNERKRRIREEERQKKQKDREAKAQAKLPQKKVDPA